MEKLQFPQAKNVPESIKIRVMEHVIADVKYKGNFMKRARLVRIFVPTFAMGLFMVGLFSIVYNVVRNNATGNTDELEKKLVEIENILNELDNI